MGMLALWQYTLATIMGVVALLSAGLPLYFWWLHRRDQAASRAPKE